MAAIKYNGLDARLVVAGGNLCFKIAKGNDIIFDSPITNHGRWIIVARVYNPNLRTIITLSANLSSFSIDNGVLLWQGSSSAGPANISYNLKIRLWTIYFQGWVTSFNYTLGADGSEKSIPFPTHASAQGLVSCTWNP